ncbi:hypothetical protein Tco_0680313 [Tanacetum coccineum]|uniref:Tf2-1-like SH3-like domain-containing protein n=1 Tax=Tanacetum coccineum TaxID=301880 RepID=A0ABQ4XK62_9ASTR
MLNKYNSYTHKFKLALKNRTKSINKRLILIARESCLKSLGVDSTWEGAFSRFGKLQLPTDGPFRVIKRINDNAYKIDLPEEEIEDVKQDLKANLFHARGYGALD